MAKAKQPKKPTKSKSKPETKKKRVFKVTGNGPRSLKDLF